MINVFAEGKFIDMWTVPHTLFGVILFFVFYKQKWNLYLALFLSLIISIFWEFFEINVKIDEVMTNRITDVLVTLIGFYVVYYANKKNSFFENYEYRDTLWRYVLMVFILINVLGWMSFVFL